MSSRALLICFLTLLFLSCGKNPKTDNLKPSTETILDLNNRKVYVDSISAFVERKMKEMKIPGVSMAIINDGHIVFHKVYGYANMDTRQFVSDETLFEGASTSKPVFASMVMMLIEEKQLDLDTPISEYLQEKDQANFNFDPRFKKITPRMVLSHTTGFPNWRGNGDLTISFEPGSDFSYSGEGYQYLVKAIEAILKTNYLGLEEFFQKRIASPLDMNHTNFVQDEYNVEHKAFPHFNGATGQKNEWSAREFNAASALHTESQEFALWLMAIMNDQLMSPGTSAEMLKDQITSKQAPSLKTDENAIAWTLGFAKYRNSGHTVYGHEGNNDGFNALFLFDKRKKWGMIQFNNANEVYDFGYDLFGYINSSQ